MLALLCTERQGERGEFWWGVVEDDVGSGEPQSMMKVRDESLGGGAAALVFSVGTFTAHVHARGACPCMCSSSLWLSHSCAFAAMSHNPIRRLLEDQSLPK